MTLRLFSKCAQGSTCIATAILISGCGEGANRSDSASLDAATVTTLEHGALVYGYSFVGEPPEGQRLRIAIHVGGQEDACAKYRGELDTSDTFWYVTGELASATSGSLQLVTPGTVEHPEAVLQIVRIVGLEKSGRFWAQSGSITLAGDWSPAGGSAAIHIEAKFPGTGLMQTGECDAAGTATETTKSECRCRQTDGSTTTCTPIANEDCCVTRLDAEPAAFDFTYQGGGTYCSAMCTYSQPELAKYCRT